MDRSLKPIFDIDSISNTPAANLGMKAVRGALGHLLGFPKLQAIYEAAVLASSKKHFADKVLDVLDVSYDIPDVDREHLSAEGPLMIVANHPYGGIEGLVLASLLLSVRPDVKVMANNLLMVIPELRDLFIAVDPFGSETSFQRNVKPLKETMSWLRQGGAIVVFPAGAVSHMNMRNGKVIDPEWSTTVARVIRKTKCHVVPLYVDGSNGVLFQLAGVIHSRMRTALLAREFANKKNKCISLRAASPVLPNKWAHFATDRELIDYLRFRTYAVGVKGQERHKRMGNHWRPVISAISSSEVARVVRDLPEESRLLEAGEFEVYGIYREQAPAVVQEIGRLRETTFRGVDEGTGRRLDIDRFDRYYLHLFVWNRAEEEIVGAYRLGLADEIVRYRGPRGLYTSQLFKFDKRFYENLNQSLELGRSFVQLKYQKSASALLLLWKGIAQFITRNPRYSRLFGPVSISNAYSHFSRTIMVDYLRKHHALEHNFKIKAKMPHKDFKASEFGIDLAVAALANIHEVSELISDVEGKPEAVPILVRQYLKLGAKVLGFNVDRNFGSSIDCLILVDLLKTDPKTLRFYFGKESFEAFYRFHGLTP